MNHRFLACRENSISYVATLLLIIFAYPNLPANFNMSECPAQELPEGTARVFWMGANADDDEGEVEKVQDLKVLDRSPSHKPQPTQHSQQPAERCGAFPCVLRYCSLCSFLVWRHSGTSFRPVRAVWLRHPHRCHRDFGGAYWRATRQLQHHSAAARAPLQGGDVCYVGLLGGARRGGKNPPTQPDPSVPVNQEVLQH